MRRAKILARARHEERRAEREQERLLREQTRKQQAQDRRKKRDMIKEYRRKKWQQEYQEAFGGCKFADTELKAEPCTKKRSVVYNY